MIQIPDVVIVGGGIFGAALAYEFGKRTIRTVLLEGTALGSGATGTSFGWINALSKGDDSDYFALNLAGMSTYEKLSSEYGEDALGLSSGGSLTVSPSNEANSVFDRLQTLQDLHYPVVALSPGEAASLEPGLTFEENSVSLYCPSERILDPVKFTRFLGNEAAKMRVAVKEYEPVRELSMSSVSGTYTVRTETNSYSTRVLILASGTSTRALFGQIDPQAAQRFVKLKRSPGLLVTLSGENLSNVVRRVVYPGGGLHLRPSPSGLLLASDIADAELDRNPTADLATLTSQIIETVLARFPDSATSLREAKREVMLGQRVLPVDEHPIVGAVPGFPGLFLALTHSGITLAPYLAHLLATEILSGQPTLLPAYRPERFGV